MSHSTQQQHAPQQETEPSAAERDTMGDQETCSECTGRIITSDERGERVCEDCGLVIDSSRVDRGAEWRAFDAEERDAKSRVGAPVTNTRHDKGLSTTIDWRDRDANGNSLSSSQRTRMSRLRKWNKRFKTRDGKDRNLREGLGEIQRMSSALGVPDAVTETASVLYRRAVEEGLLPGRSIESISTACVYAAARQCGAPRTLDEMYPVSRVPGSDASPERDSGSLSINRAYKYLVREFDLEMKPVNPKQYVNRFVNALDSAVDGDSLRRCAVNVLSSFERENKHSGKAPSAVAAGAVYTAAVITGVTVTQSDVAAAAGCCEVTVRNHYQEMIAVHDTSST